MQSILYKKAPIYAIPDKVRWDAWWLTLPIRALAGGGA